MKAKDYLKQLVNLDGIIKNKLVEKAQWKDIAVGVTAHSDGERVQSSGRPSKMSDAIDRCVDLEKEIDKLVDRLIDVKTDIIKTIESLPPIEYDVLHKRYIQGKTFDEIGAMCGGRSKSWATTVHGRALHHVQMILDAREKEAAEKVRARVKAAFGKNL